MTRRLKAWADATTQLGLVGIRLLGSDGRRILYSSFLDLDAKERTAGRIVYKNYNEDGKDRARGGSARRCRTNRPACVIDGAQRCVRLLRSGGRGCVGGPGQAGTLVFYVSVKDLLGPLALSAGFPVDQVSLVGNAGVLINGPIRHRRQSRIRWSRSGRGTRVRSSFVTPLP